MKAIFVLAGLVAAGPLRVVALAAARDAGTLALLVGFAAAVVLAFALGGDFTLRRLGEALFGRAGDAAEDEALYAALAEPRRDGDAERGGLYRTSVTRRVCTAPPASSRTRYVPLGSRAPSRAASCRPASNVPSISTATSRPSAS
jgi:hypothetical protein